MHTARRRRILAIAAAGTALVAATPSVGTPTAVGSTTTTPATQRAVVVHSAQPLSATVGPRPIAIRRVATGLMMLQVDGEPLRVCVGAVLNSYPAKCGASVSVTGVGWDQITWKEKVNTTTFAVVDIIGVLSGTGMSSTLAVEEIGPAGSFVVTSDTPRSGFAPPPMACLLSSDLGGDPTDANGLETVSGYQGAWTDGKRFNVATLADPAMVEKQIRELGYRGPLCIGTLAAPTYAELAAAQQAALEEQVLALVRGQVPDRCRRRHRRVPYDHLTSPTRTTFLVREPGHRGCAGTTRVVRVGEGARHQDTR